MSDNDPTLFDDLRALDKACGHDTSKNDRAIVLLAACIERGVNTRARLVAVLKHLGFTHSHLAIMLNDGVTCSSHVSGTSLSKPAT
ncbi:hypothetical protein [Sphingobium abikonense]|uniref:hypothetical protein n=1 Tax=Sphingobium abikonense TaxID=86193 RepID=UPI003512C899